MSETKDTFTFKHDYGARNDPKLQEVCFDVGGIGGYIFWCTVEMLYEQGGFLPRNSYKQIARASFAPVSKVKKVIEEHNLFKFDENLIWNDKVLEQIALRNVRRENRKNAATIRWDREREESKRIASAMQVQCESNALEHNNNVINNNASISPNGSIEACPPQDGRTQETLLEFESKDGDKDISIEGEQPQESPVLSPKQCQQVVDFWNRTIDETKAALPKVKTLGEERIKKIRVRWKEFSEIGDPVEITRVIFKNACASKFFQGDNHNGWSGNFDWIFTNSKNWAKVYEGNYNDNKGAAVQEQPKAKKTYKTIQDLAADQGWR